MTEASIEIMYYFMHLAIFYIIAIVDVIPKFLEHLCTWISQSPYIHSTISDAC